MTVETTLPHGLKTSVFGSQWNAEHAENLALLDPDRITSGPLAARPAAGVTRRFYFATDSQKLYYDTGAAWAEQSAAASAHAAAHSAGGADALTLAQSQVVNLAADLAAKEPANANIQAHIASAANPHAVTKAQIGLGNADNSSDANKPVSAAQQAALNLKQDAAGRDASGGYAGLTLFKINFRNALNTVTSFFTNANSAARTYTFQDRDGTIADNTDLAGKANAAHTHTESDIANLAADLAAKAADSAAVHNAGNETVAGVKTFSSAPVISPLTGILKGNGAAALTVAAAGTDYADPKGILGSTGGNILRKAFFSILKHASGGLSCQSLSGNGRSFNSAATIDGTATGNIAKGGSATVGSGGSAVTYSLNAGGTALTIDLVENVTNILSLTLDYNSGGVDILFQPVVTGNNIILGAYHPTTGAAIDMTGMTPAGNGVYLHIEYIAGGAA